MMTASRSASGEESVAGMNLDEPLTIRGRDGACTVTFVRRLFLAPMEGVTDAVFRDLVIDLGGVGGACTEFVRVSSSAIPARVIRKYLGAVRLDVPVAVQVMAADADFLSATIVNAEAAGAAWIDLNFGCPAPVVFNKCAGSAMLAKPEALAAIVRTAVAATTLPVSVKMRAGIDSAQRMNEVLHAAAEAGAAMLTLHARLRCQGYHQPATWSWIADAMSFLRARGLHLPLVGNGSVERPEHATELRQATGCDAVMIGRGALANPWIFRQIAGSNAPTIAEAADFPQRYAATVLAARGPAVAIAKLKQLVRWYQAAGIFSEREEERRRLLRCAKLEEILGFFRDLSAVDGNRVHSACSAPPRSS